jgi:hypothetical protein
VLIPVSLGWFLFLAALEVGRDRDWNLLVVLLVAVTVMAVAGALLRAAIGAAQRNRELEEVR